MKSGDAKGSGLRDIAADARYLSLMSNAERRAAMSVRKAPLGDDDGRFDSRFWALQTPEARIEAVWQAVLDWAAMDRWLEEDEEVLGHPRDPYTRCDPIHSTRHVQVRIDGTLVADSTRSVMLFETGLPTRYYLPADDVRVDLLEPSAHTSFCPYKGRASYHSVRVGENVRENIVWYYQEPFDEVAKIRDLLAFYDEQVEVTIDGVVQPQPASPWS
jgi:uncharacterized protein (DUF427 family)